MSNGYQTTNQITGNKKWWALATVMVTMFFASMNQTVVSTAIPTIVSDLQGFELYAWIFSSFMITSAVTVPIYGKLSDIYGRRPFYIFGLIVFSLGSILSGLAESMTWLIVARAVQGIGAGAMMSMPRATIGDIFNPVERGRWMGVIGAVFGLSSILGPTIGGWITDHLSWHWVFFINLPFAALALIGVFYALPKVKVEQQAKIDWLGTFLLVIGLIPILLGFTWIGDKFSWSDWQTLVLFVGGGFVLLIFAFYETRVKEPIVDTALFKNQLFSVTLVLGIFISMAMFGATMFLPLYIQGVIGLSAQNSGLVMAPMMISFIIGSIISGQVMTKTGKYKRLSHICAVFIVIGLYLFTTMDVDTSHSSVILNMVILGLGIGSLMPLLNVAVQNAFPYRLMGTVNSTQQFVTSLGGVIASPIFGSLLNNGFKEKLDETIPEELATVQGGQLSELNPQSLLTAEAQAQLKESFSQFGDMGLQLFDKFIHAVKVSLTSGMYSLFLVALVFGVLTFLGTFLMPEQTLKGDEYFKESNEQK